MFQLGEKSRRQLRGVHEDLVKVVERAIQLTLVDFTVFQGLRSLDEQKDNVIGGVSWTLNSRHLTGHAVDLVPFHDADGDGDCELSWDWPSCYAIARAVQQAAKELGIRVIWGACWDYPLNSLTDDLELEAGQYAERRRKLGKRVKLDGAHFELDRRFYD